MRTVLVRASIRSGDWKEEHWNHLVPSASVPLLMPILREHDFVLTVKKLAASRWGRFQYYRGRSDTYVFLNNTLEPEAMLVTFLHEFAHFLVWKHHGPDAPAHGPEWKSAFRTLAIPFLKPEIFSKETLRYFAHYLKNPRASATAHPGLFRALTAHEEQKGLTALSVLPEGTPFKLNGRHFVKGPKIRTRYRCQSPDDGRQYLVNQSVRVELLGVSSKI
jgi:SprT protein